MASPQLEHGHTRIANELLESITRFNFSKRQYKVLFAVIRKTYGYNRKTDVIASSQLAQMTGLTSSHCRETVLELTHLQVLTAKPAGNSKRLGLNKNYDCWGVPKQDDCPRAGRPKTGQSSVPNQDAKPSQNGTHKRKKEKRNKTPLPAKVDKYTTDQAETPSGGGSDFLFTPKALSRMEADRARQLIKSITKEQQQPVLDVLSAMITAGEIKKSPLAALGGIIRRYQSGTFDPSPGIHLAEQRERRACREAAQLQKETEITGSPPTAEEIIEAKEKLHQFIRPRLVHG